MVSALVSGSSGPGSREAYSHIKTSNIPAKSIYLLPSFISKIYQGSERDFHPALRQKKEAMSPFPAPPKATLSQRSHGTKTIKSLTAASITQ